MRLLRHLSTLIEHHQWDDVTKRLHSLRGMRESKQQTSSNKNSNYPGWYPLHLALLHEAPTPILELLLEHFPLAAQKPVRVSEEARSVLCRENAALRTSLSEAAAANSTKNTFEHQEDYTSLSSSSSASSQLLQDQDAWLPLHLASCTTTSPPILRQLLSTYPSAVAIPTTLTQLLPLHLACHHARSHLSISILLKYFPKAASKITPHNGWLALHYSCRYDATVFVVQTLLQIYQEAAQQETKCGALALHLACRYHADEAAIIALLDAYPQAAELGIGEEENSWLPLHLSIRCGGSGRTILEVLKVFPEAAQRVVVIVENTSSRSGRKQKSKRGLLPLHLACGYRAQEEGCIVELVRVFPEAASRCAVVQEEEQEDDENEESGGGSGKDWLPIHHACLNRASERSIRALLRAYPEGAQRVVCNNPGGTVNHHPSTTTHKHEQQQNNDKSTHQSTGWLPLHIATRNSTPLQSLLQTYPTAAHMLTPCGSTPLHLACRYSAEETDILHLLRVYPGAAKLPVPSDQSLPLHIACQYGASEKCIVALWKAYPEAAGMCNGLGWYPLHIVCGRGGASERLIVGLLDLFPEAASKPVTFVGGDGKNGTLALTNTTTTTTTSSSYHPRNGGLPLHLACHHGASPRTILRLLLSFREAVHMPDSSGKRPVHYAKQACASLDVIRVLQRANWESWKSWMMQALVVQQQNCRNGGGKYQYKQQQQQQQHCMIVTKGKSHPTPSMGVMKALLQWQAHEKKQHFVSSPKIVVATPVNVNTTYRDAHAHAHAVPTAAAAKAEEEGGDRMNILESVPEVM